MRKSAKINSKKQNKKINNLIRIACITSALAAYSSSIYAAVVGNNTLPTRNEEWLHGSGNITTPSNNIMNIVQNEQNAVIKWNDFSIGANAEVNFSRENGKNFNVLNYVDSGKVSQIYGGINAKEGNVFVVNTAGAIIGKSAQINVGSLYVSNKKMDNGELKAFYDGGTNPTINGFVTGAEIMSLGNINANKVTFEGDRIVLDINRLVTNGEQMKADDILLKTSSKNNVVAGYDAYDEGSKSYVGKNTDEEIATIKIGSSEEKFTKAEGYMWVKTLDQLQAMNTNLEGNYALNDSIDAIPTNEWDGGKGFESIGEEEKPFTGKFDGLDYNIFGLTIKRDGEENVGLFGYTDGATINNVTLVAGNIIGGDNVGSVVGYAKNTNISNVTNSVEVSGNSNVGGVVGKFESEYGSNELKNIVNIGVTKGHASVGGIAGNMNGGKLTGQSYNLGAVIGIGKEDENSQLVDYSYDIGGLVGSAANVQLGDGETQIFNQLNITGGYNVGGIVGSIKDKDEAGKQASSINNAVNNGDVLAVGYTMGEYKYQTSNQNVLGNGDKCYDEMQGEKTVNVYVANAGGIAGSVESWSDKKIEIQNVQNNGDVKTETKNEQNKENGSVTYDYYIAGNVGGVVGSANNANIKDAKNVENNIRGAHNVGGIAGYFENGKIDGALNDGGDIMGTGARNDVGWVTETLRSNVKENNNAGDNEKFNVGNIGGIVGYLYEGGEEQTTVSNSGNRGNVHSDKVSDNIINEKDIVDSAKASNVGGIVGKINAKEKSDLSAIKNNDKKASVSNSYNTGKIQGYTGVGGVVGSMWNGAVTYSYNLGNIVSSRMAEDSGGGGKNTALNMGGIVGDTTEQTHARAVIYNVFNKGTIGDADFKLSGRHVGGIVGRLSGYVDTSFNNGNIYNSHGVVGGIAGYLVSGGISNVFNTGNITVDRSRDTNLGSAVGGLVGDASGYFVGEEEKQLSIENAYNLGVVRGDKYVAGIIASTNNHSKTNWKLSLKNVYTTGNIWANNSAGYIIANTDGGANGKLYENVFYMSPDGIFEYLHKLEPPKSLGGDKVTYDSNNENNWDTFIKNSGDGTWRIYDGTTPILNVFKPGTMTSDYFGKDKYEDYDNFSNDVQYGTAYDPFLTIINANKNINVDWNSAGFGIAEGLVVNGAGVSITNFGQKTGSTVVKDVLPYGGIIYSDGLTSISSSDGNNIFLGSAAKIYGSAVEINSGGDLIINGLVQSTGNNETLKNNGDVALSGNNVTVYGEIKSAQKDENIVINGIEKEYIEPLYSYGEGDTIDPTTYLVKYITEHLGTYNDRIAEYVKNKENEMPTISDYLAKTVESKADGDITITANKENEGKFIDNGNVKVLFGNEETGFVNAGGNLTVSGNDVYMDSDLLVGGNLTINGNTSVLDISNIGKVQTDKGLIDKGLGDEGKDLTDDEKALIGLHKFLDHFQNDKTIIMQDSSGGNTSDAMITVDLWGNGEFDLSKFDLNDDLANILNKDNGHTLSEDLQKLNLTINGTGNDEGAASRKYVHIWVSDGEQLKGIQEKVSELAGDQDKNKVQGFLKGNFALKNDIDASAVEGYKSIGEGVEGGFTGKFDGRGNRIIGLNIEKGAGIFNEIGKDGSVDDVKIYSSNVSGAGNVGMVAGTNSGSITNITTFGNSVAGSDEVSGMAGGIVGNNNGRITNVSSTSIVESISDTEGAFHLGGIAGVNEKDALIENSESNSALTITAGSSQNTGSIGGIVGNNNGKLNQVSSSGIISGLYKHRGNDKELYHVASHVGGIAGINSGTIIEAYNDSIVAGMLYVGGVVGKNTGEITNIANATYVYGGENVGGIVGYNDGTITDGRNNGAIFGAKGIEADKEIYRDDDIDKKFPVFTSTGKNIGGLVGYSGTNGKMSNLVNDMSASITGYENVGGIIGENHGVLTDSQNLMNKGTISGVTDVGGIIGENYGIVANINNQNTFDIVINKAYESSNDGYKYFGGIVGHNVKDDNETGIVYNVSNSGNVKVEGAQFVGGVIGQNDGIVLGTLANSGTVQGESNVGGIIGINKNGIDATSVISPEAIKDLAQKGIKVDNGKVVLINGAKVKVDENGQAKFTEFVLHGNTVKGVTNVGGVIGENTGNITNSDVINSVVAEVEGENNVGGIIGVNAGNVAGSRDKEDNYYANHVYNNGSVFGDENIGGLIGENNGTIDAAYNTGTVEGKVNVGGIAGTNSGTISQVFNNVMIGNKDSEQKYTVGSVKGETNVGGLVGVNNGNLQYAYNSSNVESTNGGNIVGTNGDKGVIIGVYDAYNTNGTFAGQNIGVISNSYSVSKDDKNKDVTVLSGEKAKDSDYYEDGFWEKDENGENKTWKFYDGLTNPLLKVFLTKATYEGFDGTFDKKNFEGADGNNAFEQNNWLVQVGEYKYNYYLYSQQIIGSYYEDGNFNPNNLGYDLDAVFNAPKQPSFWEAEDKYAWTWDKKREDRERKAELHFISGGMEL